MGDFFTRLAERTLGLAPVVQPDLMPLLLPLAESEVVSDALPGLEPVLERGTTPASKAAPQDGRFDKPEHRYNGDRRSRRRSAAKLETRLAKRAAAARAECG